MDIISSVLSGTAGGLLADRLRRHTEKLSNPVQQVEEESERDVLEDIRDTIYAYLGQIRPAPRVLEASVTLNAYPNGGYIVRYEGRTRMNIYCPGLSIYIETRFGQYTQALPIGWSNVDLPGGSTIYVPTAPGTPRDVYIQYANYAHGASL